MVVVLETELMSLQIKHVRCSANASLKGGTGKPNNRGFMCGKTMSYGIDNSDYGSGDPASA